RQNLNGNLQSRLLIENGEGVVTEDTETVVEVGIAVEVVIEAEIENESPGGRQGLGQLLVIVETREDIMIEIEIKEGDMMTRGIVGIEFEEMKRIDAQTELEGIRQQTQGLCHISQLKNERVKCGC
ncbi:hypothetical protein ANCDUO_20043, partial [Ancylostoma duodenale]